MNKTRRHWQRLRFIAMTVCFTLLAVIFCSKPSASQEWNVLGSPTASISPNGRYYLLADGVHGVRLMRFGSKVNSLIRRIHGTFFNYFVTTPWSLDSKTYLTVTGPAFGSGISNEISANSVVTGRRTSLYVAGGVRDATFSPAGDEVAFVTDDRENLLRENIIVWKPRFGSRIGISKTFKFNKGVEQFSWIDRHRLLAYTPGIVFPRFIPKSNSLFLVDTQSMAVRRLRVPPSGMILQVWPYSDGVGKVIVLWYHPEHVTDPANEYYVLSETDCGTGQMTDIAKIRWQPDSDLYPLSCGPSVTFVETLHWGKRAHTVDIWRIDCLNRLLGRPVTLRLYGLPSIDSRGKVFGWLGENAGYAITKDEAGILPR
jgi:hypothetical protein